MERSSPTIHEFELDFHPQEIPEVAVELAGVPRPSIGSVLEMIWAARASLGKPRGPEEETLDLRGLPEVEVGETLVLRLGERHSVLLALGGRRGRRMVAACTARSPTGPPERPKRSAKTGTSPVVRLRDAGIVVPALSRWDFEPSAAADGASYLLLDREPLADSPYVAHPALIDLGVFWAWTLLGQPATYPLEIVARRVPRAGQCAADAWVAVESAFARVPCNAGAFDLLLEVLPPRPGRLLERIATSIVRDVLGLGLSTGTTLIEQGATSLDVTRVITELETCLGHTTDSARFLAHPTIAELVEVARSPAVEVDSGSHLHNHTTLAQQQVWAIHSASAVEGSYNECISFRYDKAPSRDALSAALAQLVQRHDALRGCFHYRGGRLLREVGDPPAGLLEWRHSGENDVSGLVRDFGRAPFSIEHGRVFRALCVETPGGTTVALAVHHIAADGWSLANLLLPDLSLLYDACVNGAESPSVVTTPLQDAIALESWKTSGPHGDDDIRWWRQALQKTPAEVSSLSERRGGRSLTTASSALAVREIDREMLDELRGVATRAGVTPAALFVHALQVVIFHHYGQTAFATGLVVANRTSSVARSAVGHFSHVLPIPCRMSGDDRVRASLSRVGRLVAEAMQRQHVPLSRIVAASGNRMGVTVPFLQVVLAYDEQRPSLRLGNQDAAADLVHLERPKFDLFLRVMPSSNGSAELRLEHALQCIERSEAEAILGHLVRLLHQLPNVLEESLKDLQLMPDEERAATVVALNATTTSYDRTKTVVDLFREQSMTGPDRIVARCKGDALTYGQAWRWASAVAEKLREVGVERGSRVGLLMHRGLEVVAGIYGILSTGAVYVPLDERDPAERSRRIVKDSGMRLLLCDAALEYRARALCGRVVRIEDVERSPMESVGAPVPGPDDPAYILYTSGSTGEPKGVVVDHRVPSSMVEWARRVHTAAELRAVLASSSLSFDMSLFEFLVPSCTGNQLVIVDDVLALCEQRPDVSLINTVPSAIAAVLDGGTVPPSARCINLAGERLRQDLVERLHAESSLSRVNDVYGPTETNCVTWCGRVPGGAETIGWPLPNAQVYVCDPDGRVVPWGAEGELWVGGESLAREYLNDPELTGQRFVRAAIPELGGRRLYRTGDRVRLTSSGLKFLGREDGQVKVRGYRVELGALEAAASVHPGVLECMAYAADRGGSTVLGLAFVPSSNAGATPAEVRGHLLHVLPPYCVPSEVHPVDTIPRLRSGKVDRSAPAAPRAPRTVLASREISAAEAAMCGLWAEVLGIEHVGVDDDFFTLGGHSLLVPEVVFKARLALGLDFSLQDLIAFRTVEDLIALDRSRREGPSGHVVRFGAQQGGAFVLVHPFGGGLGLYRHLVSRLSRDAAVYGVTDPALFGDGALSKTIEGLAATHAEVLAQVPQEPLRIVGASMGGLIAWEIARELRTMGRHVELVALVDTPPAAVGRRLATLTPGEQLWGLAEPWVSASREAFLDLDHAGQMEALARGVFGQSRSSAFSTKILERWLDVCRGHLAALQQYVPRSSTVPMVYYQAQAAGAWSGAEAAIQWSSLAAQAEVVEAPGDHHTMLAPPHVEALAANLLRKVQLAVSGRD